MSEDSIFTKIINGQIPSVKLYEDEFCIAILDKFPASKGQALVIPKQQIDYLFNLPEKTYQHCWAITNKIVKAIDKTLKPIRTCIVVEGFEVPHAHIRIHPAYAPTLPRGKTETSDNELKNTASIIISALKN